MTIGLELVQRSSLSEAVFDQLCQQILTDRVEPGQSLPPERQLAEVLGVNRGAVREGLKRLAQAGLVEQRHGGGTFVLDYRRSADLGLLGRLLLTQGGEVDVRVARSIMEMRATLAPDIARLCALRATPAQIAALEAVVAQLRDTDDLDALQTLSLEFWEQLVEGSGNIAYRLALNTLYRTYEQIRGLLLQPLALELRAHERYAELVRAVGLGDGAAAQREAAAIVALGTAGLETAFELLDQLRAGAQS